MDKIPKVRFFLFLYFLHALDLQQDVLWNEYFHEKGGKLHISLMWYDLPINFGYCATPRLNMMKPWDFHVLLVGCNRTTWMAIVFALLALLIPFHFASGSPPLHDIVLSLVSVMIAPAAKLVPKIRRSKLFFLWLFLCYVIAHCYTGKNASFVIKHKAEEVIETLSAVSANNFSLIFNIIMFSNLLKIW